MEVMGVVAVMVNLALLGMGGSVQRMFPNMTVTDRIILIVVLEVCFHTTTSILGDFPQFPLDSLTYGLTDARSTL